MKFENYEIKKEDERNWSLVRHDVITADRDIKKPGSDEIVHKKGDKYTKSVHKGYFGEIVPAIKAIYNDKLGAGCETLIEVIEQAAALRRDLDEALAFSAANHPFEIA